MRGRGGGREEGEGTRRRKGGRVRGRVIPDLGEAFEGWR